MLKHAVLLTLFFLYSVSYGYIGRVTVLQNPATKQIIYCLGDDHAPCSQPDEHAQPIIQFLEKFCSTYDRPMTFLVEMHAPEVGRDDFHQATIDARIARELSCEQPIMTLPLQAHKLGLVELCRCDKRPLTGALQYYIINAVQPESSVLRPRICAAVDELSAQYDDIAFADLDKVFEQKYGQSLLRFVTDAAVQGLFSDLSSDIIAAWQDKVFKLVRARMYDHSFVFDRALASESDLYEQYWMQVVAAMCDCYESLKFAIVDECEKRNHCYELLMDADDRYACLKNIVSGMLEKYQAQYTQEYAFSETDAINMIFCESFLFNADILHRIFAEPSRQLPMMLYAGNRHIDAVVDLLYDCHWQIVYDEGCSYTKGRLPMLDPELLEKALDFDLLASSMCVCPDLLPVDYDIRSCCHMAEMTDSLRYTGFLLRA